MSRPLEPCRVHVSQRLVDAMATLERGNVQIALVTDDQDRLVGTLTDGDIRRALLVGVPMAAPLEPYVRRTFVSVPPEAGRSEVVELMQARRVGQIPIVDRDGKLVGLHLLHEMLGAVERPNWAIIMAGGKGTRLHPLTADVPKPMLPVAGRPILERIVLHLVGFGIRRIFLAVNHLSDVIERHFGDGQLFGCRIEYLRERRPLGTGGALSLLPAAPEDSVLALNGDIVTQFDVHRLLAFHQAGGFAATVGVCEYTHTVPFGVVEVNEGRMISITEKPTIALRTNGGIYVLGPHLPARVPAGTEFHLPALIDECLHRNELVGAFPIESDWVDVGRPRELRRARGEET